MKPSIADKIQFGIAISVLASFLSGCYMPAKLTPEKLSALGVREGAEYRRAQQNLMKEGYSPYVTGAKQENFDFTRQTGFFPTCILRIQFTVNDQHLISNLRVADPACIGTP